MTPQTNTFLSVAAQTGAVDGSWMQVPRTDRTHIPVSITLAAGTATWAIQGRNSPLDAAVELDTGSASEAVSVQRMAQMRVVLSAATGATVEATADMPMRTIA